MLTEREKKVLKILLDSNSYITAKQISLLSTYSERTVRTYIKTLNLFLEEYDSKILTKKGVGYILDCNDRAKLTQFINQHNQYNRIYKILHIRH